MNIRNSNSPFGSDDLKVTKLIGSSYDIVKSVYDNLDKLTYLSRTGTVINYTTYEEGVRNTNIGDYFAVLKTDDPLIWSSLYYVVSDSLITHINDYPSADAMAEFLDTIPSQIMDAKARANHTGTQAISTVSGLQTALDARATTAALASSTGGEMVGLSDGGTVEEAVAAALKGAAAVGRKLAFFSGTVCQAMPGAGWVFIADANHQQVGFDPTLSLSGSALQINFGASVAKVVTMLAVPDEDYAASGLTCGVSVGMSSVLLSFFGPFEMRTSGTAVVFGNFIEAGVDATATVDVANGTITVVHNAMSHVDSSGSPPSIAHVGLPDGNQFSNIASCTKTGFVINTSHPISGRINGATLVSQNLGTSVSWNGTNTLTITHPQSGVSLYDVGLAPELGTNLPICTSSTATTITVQFRDYAGALVTGATCPGAFRYVRGGTARSTLSSLTKMLVRRGPMQLRADYVAGAGNIWLFGVMELV